jgi:hypothetical protein
MPDKTSTVTSPIEDLGTLALTAAIKSWLFNMSGQSVGIVQITGDAVNTFRISTDPTMVAYTVVPAGGAFNMLVRASTTYYLKRDIADVLVGCKTVG